MLVHFLADQFEGQREWVPPTRLKVPWSELEEFTNRELQWAAVIEASTPRNPAVYFAVVHVFEKLIDRTMVTTGSNRTAGLSTIHDIDRLAQSLAICSEDLLADPNSFVDRGGLIVPWAVTQLIARRAASLNPVPILRLVDDEESEYRFKTMHGQAYPASRGCRGYIEADRFAQELDEPYNRACWQTLRDWCGVHASREHDELRGLRQELTRLRDLTHDAIAALRQASCGREADEIEQRLLKRRE